ncbi:MAG: NAD(P)/FAD-dependent oxidoreductase [Syntrophales bacterium LBB04]|nr:NAD(P)/FAD-dependent oxidoreductase [Syntrophales bacterium LBB04]
MEDYDVIVIGAGPAGCYAALTAALKGCRVALFEEHRAIGWPRHDPGWLMESDFTESLINALGNVVPWMKVAEYRVSDAQSGELLEKGSPAGYVVRRDLLENEIAKAAVRAGVSLYIRTKVLKFIRKNGKVEGVATNSPVIPTATGKIFICADGIRSSGTGFAVKEGLCEKGEMRSGLSYMLANVDVSSGIVEHFLSADPSLNYKCFFTHGEGLCIAGGRTPEAFEEFRKRSDNVISQKIKNAYALEISGFARARSGKYGEYFKRIVKDNILFIGDASGGAGNIHGMIQGKFSGTVASLAINTNDISEKKLSEYEDLVSATLRKAPFFYYSAREDFGTFQAWFRAFEMATKGIFAEEIAQKRSDD